MTASGLNHHLWRNRGTWWAAFSVLVDGHRQIRIRRSLKTRDVETARLQRDALMRDYAGRAGVQLAVRLPAGLPDRDSMSTSAPPVAAAKRT